MFVQEFTSRDTKLGALNIL